MIEVTFIQKLVEVCKVHSYNHTSTGILICNSLASLQMLAKHEDILMSAVKQFHSLL